MHRIAIALVLTLAASFPAVAQQPLARVVGGNVPVYSGPGRSYPIIARIPDGTRVPLDYCTRNDEWCFVTDTGWVLGSYLVGWAAKIPVTPPDFAGPGW